MADLTTINVTREQFDLRTRAAALYAELNQITVMTDDEEYLTWKKNREFEVVGLTNRKLRTVAGEKSENGLPKKAS